MTRRRIEKTADGLEQCLGEWTDGYFVLFVTADGREVGGLMGRGSTPDSRRMLEAQLDAWALLRVEKIAERNA